MTDAEFRAVFEQNKDAVYRFAWRMCGSAPVAEDIAQEVFLTLLRQPGRFDPARGALRSFLLAVARNLALKRWRDASRLDELDDHFVTPPADLERRETADAVGAAVASLPPLQREVLILAEYEELSLEEIARAVDAEVGTVKSRLHRARENLRQILAPLRSRNVGRSIRHGTLG
ncbi:MAG: sigma-70 family RNA polymerase sigma factor [Acidobacteriia bacterium]|nr:sigma-70 family RNA polymerase sigma factor [Terriglobia bacterium]